MDLPLIVATIVAKVKAKDGVTVDEQHLAEAITEGLKRLRSENETKYLEMISRLTDEVEKLSKHVGNMRTVSQFKAE